MLTRQPSNSVITNPLRRGETEREGTRTGGEERIERGLTMAPSTPSSATFRVLKDESMERRANVTALKEALQTLGKAFYAFEEKTEPPKVGEEAQDKVIVDEEDAKASYVQLKNAIDSLELQFIKLINASKAHNADRDQYEELRKKSGEEIASVSELSLI